MAGWQAREGETLLMPSGSQGDHLFVILNNPKQFPGYGPNPCVVLVNLSTVRQGIKHDGTCVLAAGCHPFVKQDTFVVYRSARIETEAYLDKLVKQGLFKPHDAMDAVIVTKIKIGLKSSPLTKLDFKQIPI